MEEIKIILLLMIIIERTENMKTFKASNMWKRFLCGVLSALMIFGGGGRSPTVVDAADTTDLDVTINYTGRQVQTWTAPYSGYYYVEAYGAAGGEDASRGGYGGYVKMYTYLNEGTNLYITCGQKGWSHYSSGWADKGQTLEDNPTYNGGARASNTLGRSGVGGGATSIALSNYGELKDFVSCKNDVLMVAGGGAGGSNHSSGSGGLVLYAGSGTNYSVINGADTSLLNGRFALGSPPASNEDGGGGGGGWIGGKSGLDTAGNSAGGGASFVNTSQNCVPIELVPDYNTKDGYVHITSTDYTGYYTISYDYDGGTANNPISYSVKQDDFTLTAPTKEGYTFTGWTGSNGDTPQKDVTIKKGTAENLSFKANWKVNYYWLNLNSAFDGRDIPSLPDGCTCDVYINGQLVESGVNDFFKQYPYGTTYEFKNFKTKTGLVFENKTQTIVQDSDSGITYTNCQSLKGIVKAYFNSPTYGGITNVLPIYTTKSVVTTFHRNTSSSDTQTSSQTFTYGVAGQSFSDKGWSYAGYTLLGWAYSNNATEAYHTPLNGVLDSWINTQYPKVDLYAVWSANSYKVTYDANGGTNAPAAQSFLYNSGEKLSTQIPVRTGYKFMGWRSETTTYSPGSSIPNGTQNITLKAMWIVNSYQVAFNGNGNTDGTMENECFSYDETKALNKNTYSKNGYSFKYWSTKADGSGTAYSDEQTISKLANGENVTASINPMETFNIDGKGMRYDGLEEDNSLTTGIAYKTTYTTTGYTSMGFYSKPYENAIANNNLAGKRIVVTFKAKALTPMQIRSVGLESISTGPISLGTSWNTYYVSGIIPDNWAAMYHAIIFYEPSTAGTVYVGDMSVSIVEPVNLYAQWKPTTWTVSYNANGGTGIMSADTVTYNENYVAKANQFTRTGYEFIGWTENADGSGSNWTSWIGKPWKWTYTRNITLYAQWKAKTCTITYESGGGVGNKYTQTATYDELFDTTKNKFTKTGYSFIGYADLTSQGGIWAKIEREGTKQTGVWANNSYIADKLRFYNYTDKIWITYDLLYWRGIFTADNYCSINDFTLSALWAANDYTVTLDYKKNVSSSYEKTIVVKYDSTYGELPQPVLPGWTFKGWNTKADGTGTTITEDTMYKIAGDSTLYAQWSYNPISVKVPQILTGDHTGKSQFRVKCDNIVAGNIAVEPDNSFNYTQDKLAVRATVKRKSSSNVIDKNNHFVVYDIITDKPLTAGCWQGSFNIKLTLTKK